MNQWENVVAAPFPIGELRVCSQFGEFHSFIIGGSVGLIGELAYFCLMSNWAMFWLTRKNLSCEVLRYGYPPN
jgi:hypothetical protein